MTTLSFLERHAQSDFSVSSVNKQLERRRSRRSNGWFALLLACGEAVRTAAHGYAESIHVPEDLSVGSFAGLRSRRNREGGSWQGQVVVSDAAMDLGDPFTVPIGRITNPSKGFCRMCIRSCCRRFSMSEEDGNVCARRLKQF